MEDGAADLPARGSEVVISRATPVVVTGFAGLSFALAFMASLHWFAPAEVDPVTAVLSDYALADGVGWMFAASVMGIAIAGICLTIALWNSGVLSSVPLRIAMGLLVVSALATAMFPTDEELPLSLSAEIHRYGAVTLMCSIPLVGMLVAERLDGVRELAGLRSMVLATAWVTAALLALFLVSHLSVVPDGLQQLQGMLQRLMLVPALLLLAQLLSLPLRPGAEPALRGANAR